MAAEELLLSLFDSNWFGHKTNPSQSHQVPQEKTPESDYGYHDNYSFSVRPNLKVRSLSEQLLDPKLLGSSFSSDYSLSPNSVLANKKLQTIFSGKEANDLREDEDQEIPKGADQEVREVIEKVVNKKKEGSERIRIRKKRASKLSGVSSKSLSDLEFEELKGFMDLGFVFTEEECRDSKLVSMIPGLQRFCKKCASEDHHHDHRSEGHDHIVKDHGDYVGHNSVISRPYLSEAWDVLDSEERKKKDPIVKPLVIDWKIPALTNEIYMKDQLKFWAHSVASTVR